MSIFAKPHAALQPKVAKAEPLTELSIANYTLCKNIAWDSWRKDHKLAHKADEMPADLIMTASAVK